METADESGAAFAGAIGFEHSEASAADNLWSHDLLVVRDIVGIDFSVVRKVQSAEEAFGIGLHLIEGQSAIVILVCLRKPVSERVVVAALRTKGLAHRADKHPGPMTG